MKDRDQATLVLLEAEWLIEEVDALFKRQEFIGSDIKVNISFDFDFDETSTNSTKESRPEINLRLTKEQVQKIVQEKIWSSFNREEVDVNSFREVMDKRIKEIIAAETKQGGLLRRQK